MKQENLSLMKCVKGIEELKIKEKDFERIQESKIIGIYGPNGSGKSSFKNGLQNILEEKNWNCNKDAIGWVKDKIILSRYAVFDENLVELIKGNVHEINFLNNKVTNLFELLTKRQEILGSKFSQILEFDFFKFNNEKIKDYFKKIEELKEILITTQELTYVSFSYNVQRVRLIKTNYKEFLNKIQEFGKGFLEIRIYFHKEMGLHSFNGRDWDIHKNIMAKFLDKFVWGEYSEEMHSWFWQYISNMENILSNFYAIKNNFGYVNFEKNLSVSLEDLFNIEIKDFNFSNDVSSFGKSIRDFVDHINSIGDGEFTFKQKWIEILKNVESVTELANQILDLYNLGYKIDLLPTKIESSKSSSSNLKLVHKQSNTIIQQEDIFKRVSYGEMNIISFCLFIASFIKRNDKIKKYQLIFDDPISSYDLNKVNITISIIKKIIIENENIDKVYVLSHEKHFLKEVQRYFGICKERKEEQDKCEKNNCFECNKNKIYFFLDNSDKHLLSQSDLEDDLSNYVQLLNSKVVRTKLIALRAISQCIKKIIKKMNPGFQNEKINKALKEIMKNISKNTQDCRKITNQFKKDGLNIDINGEITKDHLYAIRDNFEEDFTKWLENKQQNIKMEDLNIEDNFTIFKSQIYFRILDKIIHGESHLFNVDLSRSSEIVDILFSNKSDLIKTLEKCKKIYKLDK